MGKCENTGNTGDVDAMMKEYLCLLCEPYKMVTGNSEDNVISGYNVARHQPSASPASPNAINSASDSTFGMMIERDARERQTQRSDDDADDGGNGNAI